MELVEANPKAAQIVIDEIQKLPALLEVVHLLIERKLGHQFILTGSSARKLRRQGVHLLGGRASQRLMYPYMAVELDKRFKLNAALRQGMLPVVWGADDPVAVLGTQARRSQGDKETSFRVGASHYRHCCTATCPKVHKVDRTYSEL